jgi:hypothetical protein
MKALSLTQPWATLVVLGAKHYETRSWQTSHRGPLAIHATKTFPPLAKALCSQEPFKSALAAGGFLSWTDLPLGQVIGTVTLLDCHPVEELSPSEVERAFGDYRPGRWAWHLTAAQRLAVPYPFRGCLSLFDVPDP